MTTEAGAGLKEGKIKQNNEYGQNGQVDFHRFILLLNHVCNYDALLRNS